MEVRDYWIVTLDKRCPLALPGMKQAIACRKRFLPLRQGAKPKKTKWQYAATSLSPEQATARDLADIMRGHWGIENKGHWRRDALMGEDKHRLRAGNAPQNTALLRSAVLVTLDTMNTPFLDKPSTPLKMMHLHTNPGLLFAAFGPNRKC